MTSWKRLNNHVLEFFVVSSQGEAAREHKPSMGRYTLCQSIVMQDGTPVYKQDGGVNYLYRNERGNWNVGTVAGDNPWQALTPEWLTSSPPPVENWDGPAPLVTKPYGYGVDPKVSLNDSDALVSDTEIERSEE